MSISWAVVGFLDQDYRYKLVPVRLAGDWTQDRCVRGTESSCPSQRLIIYLHIYATYVCIYIYIYSAW